MKGTTVLMRMSSVVHATALCRTHCKCIALGSRYKQLPNLDQLSGCPLPLDSIVLVLCQPGSLPAFSLTSHALQLSICFGSHPDVWMRTWYALGSSQRIISQTSTVIISTVVGYDYSERHFVHVIILK